jgi:hypothetical protein
VSKGASKTFKFILLFYGRPENLKSPALRQKVLSKAVNFVSVFSSRKSLKGYPNFLPGKKFKKDRGLGDGQAF